MIFAKFPGLPGEAWSHGHVLCLELYCWHGVDSSAWMDILFSIFSDMGLNYEYVGAASIAGQNSRVKKSFGKTSFAIDKASKIIKSDSDYKSLYVKTDYESIIGEGPRDAFASISMDNDFGSRLSIIISGYIFGDIMEMVRAYKKLFNIFNSSKYGCAFYFPSIFGANYYAQDAAYTSSTIESEFGLSATDQHMKRIADARFNLSHSKKTYCDGYIKEIYDVNFLSEKHLNLYIGESKISDYILKFGSARKLDWGSNLWEWSLTQEELGSVRAHFESSDLIISNL